MKSGKSIMGTTFLQALALLIMAIAFTGNVNGEEEFNEEQYRRILEGETKEELIDKLVNIRRSDFAKLKHDAIIRSGIKEQQQRMDELLERANKLEGHMRVYRFQLEDAQAELTKLGYEGPLLLKDPYEYHEHKKQAAEENADSQAGESEGKAEAVPEAEGAE